MQACGGLSNYDFGCTAVHNFSSSPSQEALGATRNWWGTNATFTLRLKWDRRYVGAKDQREEFLGQIGADVAAAVQVNPDRVDILSLLETNDPGSLPEMSPPGLLLLASSTVPKQPVRTVTVSGVLYGGTCSL